MPAGYAFPDDARPHKKGSIFDRRGINAELKMDNGMVSFSELTEQWQYDFCLLPMDKDGILQMKYIAVNNARKDIAAKFGDINNVPNNLNYFDAVSGGKAYITAMDMNITRVTNALLQALEVDVTPHIICLPHQQELYKNVAIKLQYPKLIKFTRIHIDKLTELFPAFLPAQIPLMPARTKEGEYLII